MGLKWPKHITAKTTTLPNFNLLAKVENNRWVNTTFHLSKSFLLPLAEPFDK